MSHESTYLSTPWYMTEGPGVPSPQGCICLVSAKVRPQGCVMELVQDGSPILLWDTNPRVQSAVNPHEVSLPDVIPGL